MPRFLSFGLTPAGLYAADSSPVVPDQAVARALKQKYVALTNSWVNSIVFTPAEQAAMQNGKQWEAVMNAGPDDPLAKKIMAAGEPSYEALRSYYPDRVLDRT